MYMEILGKPPHHIIEQGSRRKKFFNNKFQCRIIQSPEKYRLPKSISLEKALGNCSNKSLVDLIRRCLNWDPTKRINPKEALLHEWILNGIPQNLRNRHIMEVTGEWP